jgi:hypothetical protein
MCPFAGISLIYVTLQLLIDTIALLKNNMTHNYRQKDTGHMPVY